jgi:hypothetical protein
MEDADIKRLIRLKEGKKKNIDKTDSVTVTCMETTKTSDAKSSSSNSNDYGNRNEFIVKRPGKVYIHKYMCLYICIYVYIYMFMYIYINIYV